MATRKTATDYRNQYQDLRQQQKALEARINKRFQTLCVEYPDVVLYNIPDLSGNTLSTPVCAKDFTNGNRPVARLDTDAHIRFIAVIEKHIAEQHPHKQVEIKFPEAAERPTIFASMREMREDEEKFH